MALILCLINLSECIYAKKYGIEFLRLQIVHGIMTLISTANQACSLRKFPSHTYFIDIT